MGGRKAKPHDGTNLPDSGSESQHRKLYRFSSITSFMSPQTSFMSKTFLRKKQARNSAANVSTTTLLGAAESEALLGPNNQSPDAMRVSNLISPMRFSPVGYTPPASDDEWPSTTLPRSKTMSNIPVPASRSRASSNAQSTTSIVSRTSTAFRRTRIPTPAKNIDQRNSKYVAAGNAFAQTESTRIKATRSHTTPNLLAGINKPHNAFMIQRKSLYETKPVTPVVTRKSNKENIRRTSKDGGYSQLEDRTTRRDSRFLERLDYQQQTAFKGKGKQAARNTSFLSNTPPRNSNDRVRTPPTVKRYRPTAASQSMSKLPRLSSSHEITQVKLMGPRNPPTPPTPRTPGVPRIPSFENFAATRNAKHGPTAAIRRKPPTTSLGNRRVSSQSSVRLGREVRSKSMGMLGESIPPVPPIPVKYLTPPGRILPLPRPRPRPLPNRLEHLLEEAVADSKPESFISFADFVGLRQISQSMPMAYWCGRFTTLSDQFRTAEFDRALRPIDDTDDSDAADVSAERRYKMVFKELQSLCVTTEAKESLRVSISFII
ncbi:hypothetical protein BU16DRAFT_578452 [Lophium mytilinum]|uniref:Uncharacterized protein n=1 Tax=Lophium mytilinum TaxID=390894 RepID=A0A6A6R7Z9_9PEZI|nr:hypothetical protein BU16DRAFT_578452 [Lophium mytilinum]